MMCTVKEEYALWCERVTDEALRAELLSYTEEEKKDAFYRSLAFGTGGLRGTMGAGTNRMNLHRSEERRVG